MDHPPLTFCDSQSESIPKGDACSPCPYLHCQSAQMPGPHGPFWVTTSQRIAVTFNQLLQTWGHSCLPPLPNPNISSIYLPGNLKPDHFHMTHRAFRVKPPSSPHQTPAEGPQLLSHAPLGSFLHTHHTTAKAACSKVPSSYSSKIFSESIALRRKPKIFSKPSKGLTLCP